MLLLPAILMGHISGRGTVLLHSHGDEGAHEHRLYESTHSDGSCDEPASDHEPHEPSPGPSLCASSPDVDLHHGAPGEVTRCPSLPATRGDPDGGVLVLTRPVTLIAIIDEPLPARAGRPHSSHAATHASGKRLSGIERLIRSSRALRI